MICHWTLEIICFEMQMDRLDKSESFLACHINYLIIWPLIHHPFFTGKVYKVAFFLFQLQLFSHLWDLSVVPEPGGPGGPLAPPQYLANQLTLFTLIQNARSGLLIVLDIWMLETGQLCLIFICKGQFLL